MKFIFLFIIIGLSFLKATNNVDLFYALKEKDKLEYINKIIRLYMNSVKNSSINGKNILTIRNSSIEKLILNNLTVNKTELLIIKDMEKISIDLINNGISVNCISIVSSALNVNGITNSVCFELDRKYRAIYESAPHYKRPYAYKYGIYDISKMINTSELNTSVGFFNKIKNDRKNDIILEEKIKYMTISSLQNLCDKISNNNNKSFISKENVAQAIIARAKILNFSSLVVNCSTYNYKLNHNYSYSSANIPIPTGGEIASLTEQVLLLQTKITNINSYITTLNIPALYANYISEYNIYLSTPASPSILKYLANQKQLDAKTSWETNVALETIENDKIAKINIDITKLQDEIIKLGGTI